MKTILQRVSRASVLVDNQVIAKIKQGILVFVGFGKKDTEKEIDWMANKIVSLRIFPDNQDKMNLSLKEAGGEVLVVPQFTLYGDSRKGQRPSYDKAACPKTAENLYNLFITKLKQIWPKVETGKFKAKMLVKIENDGPVTLLIDNP